MSAADTAKSGGATGAAELRAKAMLGRAAAAARALRRNWLVAAIVVGVLAGAGMGYLVGEKRFSSERDTTLEKIELYRQVLNDAVAKSKDRPNLDARLQSLANQTLGPSIETVDSEVRRRLNRVCEELGLTDFSVITGTTVNRPTPAKKEFKGRDATKLRDEIDFVEVEATVTASGTLERIYRLIFRIDAEPWTKRIGSIRLTPQGDGQIVKLSLKLRTIFVPGRSADAPLVVSAERLQSADRYAALFASNPFRIPPGPVAPPTVVATNTETKQPSPATTTDPPLDPPPSVPTPPGGFPYGEWQLTGVVEGPGGAEVWLRHLPSGATLALQPGATVGELVFRRAEYDGSAVFDSPLGSCRIQVGTNLTQRAPVSSS